MSKIFTFSLLFVAVLLTTATANAGIQHVFSEDIQLGGDQYGQSATRYLDFSDYDLTTVQNITFSFPFGLDTNFRIYNMGDGQVDINAGTYNGSFNYKYELGFGGNTFTGIDMQSETAQYTITDTVTLSYLDYVDTSLVHTDVSSVGITMAIDQFLALLSEDNILEVNVAFTGPSFAGFGGGQDLPLRVNIGLNAQPLVGRIEAIFEDPEAPPVSPEPATMLILALGLAGLGLARRRK